MYFVKHKYNLEYPIYEDIKLDYLILDSMALSYFTENGKKVNQNFYSNCLYFMMMRTHRMLVLGKVWYFHLMCSLHCQQSVNSIEIMRIIVVCCLLKILLGTADNSLIYEWLLVGWFVCFCTVCFLVIQCILTFERM